MVARETQSRSEGIELPSRAVAHRVRVIVTASCEANHRLTADFDVTGGEGSRRKQSFQAVTAVVTRLAEITNQTGTGTPGCGTVVLRRDDRKFENALSSIRCAEALCLSTNRAHYARGACVNGGAACANDATGSGLIVGGPGLHRGAPDGPDPAPGADSEDRRGSRSVLCGIDRLRARSGSSR